MSSDGYFDDELDSAFLQAVDAIEAAHTSPQPKRPLAVPRSLPSEVIHVDDSYDFDSFDVDDDGFAMIDQICNDALSKDKQYTAPPRNSNGISSSSRPTKATVQTTLFGGVAKQPTQGGSSGASSSKSTLQRRTSSSNNVFTGRLQKTKKWDHTAFAKTGWKKAKSAKEKGKATSFQDWDAGEEDDDDEEPVEFEQFPAPFISIGPPPPMKLRPDLLAARRWLYPLNQQRRDYQFNIVKRCLFENTLVALPTGLGKTFIAGVVMLNFYTWFPEGKVVFVAPTKPLVAQQIEACHKTCGIPGSHAAELTGQNSRAVRARTWQEKRVFYMTPQTLMNDLKTDNCDPQDIVLLVIDEAHKGTGDYAYAQVIRYMMAKNPHFRVLALTATPGGKPDAVQAIVDALHISHIEIRDEGSLDLKPYLHKKHIKQHIIEMSDDVRKVRDILSEAMAPHIKKLVSAKILHSHPSPVMLHPFSCNMAMQGLHAGRKGATWAFSALQKLSGLARAMGYLLESTTNQCYICLTALATGDDGTTKQGKQKQNLFKSDPQVQAVIKELEAQKSRAGGFSTHPKMDKVKTLLVEHFAQKRYDKEDADANGGSEELTGDSHVMIFVSFRQCVDEIVEFLNLESPLIRAVPFIGQGADKAGKKGYAQKEQLEVIQKFKSGQFNVLVSTSIGEEGLDIGEIDMIICYDAQKTPIRMLQRVGRTGRKREGYVHVLLSEVREERNWDKAHDNYEDVQRFIIRAEQLELYEDVERLLPENVKPECIEMEMEIEEYTREEPKAKKGPLPNAKRKPRNDDAMRNVPTGASSGFISVKDLMLKGTKKRKKKGSALVEFDPHAGEDDSDDEEIEAGIFGPRRTQSMPESSKKPRQKKLHRSTTMATKEQEKPQAIKTSRKKKATSIENLTNNQLERVGTDDNDDREIEMGLSSAHLEPPSKGKRLPRTSTPPPSPRQRSKASLKHKPPTPESPLPDDVIDLIVADTPIRISSSPDIPICDLDMDRGVGSLTDGLLSSLGDSHLSHISEELPPASPDTSPSAHAEIDDASMSWLVDDDDDPYPEPMSFDDVEMASRHEVTSLTEDIRREDSLAFSSLPSEASWKLSPSPARFTKFRSAASSGSSSRNNMPPPALPERFEPTPLHSPPTPLEELFPEPTFAVRAPGKQPRKRTRIETIDSSPMAMPPPSQKRLQRQESYSPPASPEPVKPKRKKPRFQDVVEAQKHNPWIDVEASHSGDELSQGGYEDDEVMSESDRQFASDFPETQVSPSYDQSAVYRRSLLTQAPGASMPHFANRPAREGRQYSLAAPSKARAPVEVSSSPPRHDSSDDYVFGSFIVDDDDEISYAQDSSVLSDS